MLLYRVGKVILFILFKILFRLTVKGKEHFPKEGGVLLCSNHISNFDPPILGVAAPRMIRFMGKEELFRNPFLRKLFVALGGFPIKRQAGDKEALKKGLQILNNDEVLGIFPEGTRSKTGELKPGLAGAGFFALRSNALVVPCAIIGNYKLFRKITVVFGKPIDLEEQRKNKISAKEATDIIMKEIQNILEKEKTYI